MELKKPKFSPRMKLFTDLAISDLDFWDVCCDHGYIGIHALLSHKFSKVYFVDHIPHIMNRLNSLLLNAPLSNDFQIELQYELLTTLGQNINRDVEGNLIIAGVSGRTIVQILENLEARSFLKAKRLILSPHLDQHILEDYLNSPLRKFKIENYSIQSITENKRIRPVYIIDLKEAD